jgi:hypothetical protein
VRRNPAGIEGKTDAAGAVCPPDTLARARAADLDPRAMLAARDSYGEFRALGDLLVTGPTLSNVNDVCAVMPAWFRGAFSAIRQRLDAPAPPIREAGSPHSRRGPFGRRHRTCPPGGSRKGCVGRFYSATVDDRARRAPSRGPHAIGLRGTLYALTKTRSLRPSALVSSERQALQP